MLYLVTNTPNQSAYLTLKEGALLLGTTYSHYLVKLVSEVGNSEFILIPAVINESDRITEILLGTDTLDAVNGSVLILKSGRYSYYIYGQNSATNLDPNDVSVVGLIEQGLAELTDSNNLYTSPAASISEDIVYNG